MSSDQKKHSSNNAEIETDQYRGPDRRRKKEATRVTGTVRHDEKGNPIWQPIVDAPRRRKDDDTFDLLKALDVDSLSLVDDETLEPVEGFNPYERHEE